MKQDERWGTYEEETIVKLMATKIIMNQLLNEVIEILEHAQFSRKRPEKYNFKSIFSCENIPLVSFQNEPANRMNKKLEKINEEDVGTNLRIELINKEIIKINLTKII